MAALDCRSRLFQRPETQPQGSWPAGGIQASLVGLINHAFGVHQEEEEGDEPTATAPHGSAMVQRWSESITRSLLKAAVNGDVSLARAALEQRADACAVAPADGSSILHLAAASGNPQLVRLLLDCSAKSECADLGGRTALDRALAVGHAAVVVVLLLDLEQAEFDSAVEQPETWRESLLCVVSSCTEPPQREFVRLVSRLFTQRDHQESIEQSVGVLGIFFGAIALGGDSPEPFLAQEIRRALFRGVTRGWIGGVHSLLLARASPDRLDPASKRSALELADATFEQAVAQVLRSCGASVRRNPGFEEWALCLAAARGDRRAVGHWIGQAEPNWRQAPPSDRLTALMYAAEQGNTAICQTLIHARAHVALRDANGENAASLARQRGHHGLAANLDQLATAEVDARAIALESWRGPEAAHGQALVELMPEAWSAPPGWLDRVEVLDQLAAEEILQAAW